MSQRRSLPPPPALPLPFLVDLRSKRCILASASPRRRAILTPILPKLEVIPSTFPEDLPKSMSPYEYVQATALAKCMQVYKQEILLEHTKGEMGIVVSADTIVVASDGQILEKPRSEQGHINMLKNLRDTGPHKVYTSMVCMVPLSSARDPGYAMEAATDETKVSFDPLVTDAMIEAYVKTREGVDKAGGYGLQGVGSVLVEKIEGSADNVIGLPLRKCLMLMERCVLKSDDDDLLEHDLSEANGEDSEEE
jgi:septum formation protein